MRAVNWLHISDFHLRQDESLSQKAVLSAMIEDIRRRYQDGLRVDFVLATGDLTFSGERSQYDLVAGFFGNLEAVIQLRREMIFCVPGNHDVQRQRQEMCFIGARQKLQSQNDVYAFLGDDEQRKTLLLRQENFREFQDSFFAVQQRERTPDDLGYVSHFDIEDLRIAIIGLDSAWLSQGGNEDERQLVIGEYQVNEAIGMVKQFAPHITIGILHHPLDYLQRFDQRSTQKRLEEACAFLHCGHLHEPDANVAAVSSGNCLTLAAGASVESRGYRNAYSVITFSPLASRTDVTFVQYDPTEGIFSYESKKSYPHEIDSKIFCTTGDLAVAIEHYHSETVDISYYLASLLLGQMSDLPIQTDGTVVFGTPDFLKQQPDTELKNATNCFLTVGRAIKLLHERKLLMGILKDHGEGLMSYVRTLRRLCATEPDLSEQLMIRNSNAKLLARTADPEPFQHTLSLLDYLLAEGEWDELRKLAERCCEQDDLAVKSKGKRALALCLARSSENIDQTQATNLYKELTISPHVEAEDWAGLATLLANAGDYEQAKSAIIEGTKAFSLKIDAFIRIGFDIVEATSDIPFRDWLRQLHAGERPT